MYVSFEAWQAACAMTKNEGNRLKSYLQWFPFSRLNDDSWECLISESFFNTYINDISFMLCGSMRYTTKGYIQKQGSSLRDSYLVSPVFFLYLLAYGIEYNEQFMQPRTGGLSLYAGNFDKGQMNYQRSWQAYCDALKLNSERYEYCLRTDVSNFFGTINVDSLISKMQKYSAEQYSANDGFFFKALLLYCGNGKYPTVQNHPTLSFLATDVYLADVDEQLRARLVKMSSIKSFEIIRYVDDMCLFFDLQDGANLLSVKQAITNCYADILRMEGLILNQGKLELQDANDVLRSMASVSCVDFSGEVIDEDVCVPGNVIAIFFSKLAVASSEIDYSHKMLLDIIDECFVVEEPPTPPMTVFRHCLYKQKYLFKTREAIDAMRLALANGTVLFSYNTNDLVQCILNSSDELLVKQLLNSLFYASRNGFWSSLDSLTASTYLIQRGVWHYDLRQTLKKESPGLSYYIETYCRGNFCALSPSIAEKKVMAILRGDVSSKIQYVQFLRHQQTENLFESTSYYRAFFDRFSSLAKSKIQGTKLKWLHKEKDLKKIYEEVDGADKRIHEIEMLRQQNPLVHASSEILRSKTFKADLQYVLKTIDELISRFVSSIDIEDIA